MRPVNLLPEQYRARESRGRSGAAYVVVGVLAALLVMVAVYTLTADQVSSREAQAAEAKAEAEKLEAETAALAPFGNFAQTKQARLTSVRELARGRFDWERFMRELSLLLPRGSWIHEVNASTTRTEETSGGDQATGQPSAKLSGCAPRQPETAKLMVRLRRMHRVEDVELNESVQDPGGGAATLAGCGKLYAFDVTVKFAPAPAADAGSSKRVPASLGGGE